MISQFSSTPLCHTQLSRLVPINIFGKMYLKCLFAGVSHTGQYRSMSKQKQTNQTAKQPIYKPANQTAAEQVLFCPRTEEDRTCASVPEKKVFKKVTGVFRTAGQC